MKLTVVAVPALLLVAAGSHAAATSPAWVERSNNNSALLLQLTAKYDPESASQVGVDGFDEQISDLSRDSQYERKRADYARVIAEYKRRESAESDPKVKQDLEILIDAAKDTARTDELTHKYFFPFTDVAALVFKVVQQTLDARIPAARQQSVVARLDKYAGITTGYRPFTEVAKERTMQRLKVEPKLVGPFRGQVDQASEDFPTLMAGIKDLLAKSEVVGWRPAVAALERQLTDYNAWIREEVRPRARTDHRVPPEFYADDLRHYGVDVTPAELISKSLTAFAEIRNQMTVIAALVAKDRGFADTDYHAVIRALKRQVIPPERLLALYKDRLGQIESAIRVNRIVSLPDRAASIRIATPAENAQTPAPHMSTPRLIGNTGEYGEFVLSTGMGPNASGKASVFDDFSHEAAAWSLTAHEARPGHELQFAKMIEIGVSTARALFADNSVNVEGWALYAEAEMQPYEPLEGQLIALQMRAHRAARAFLDPMVNLGQLTPEDAKSFLMEEVCLSEALATQEMQRYVFRLPGQAPSYFYGYQRLMELRQTAQLALRNRFNRLAFNDFILAQGLLPPRLLRKAVMEEFIPSQMK